MPWIKKQYTGPAGDFLDQLLEDIIIYVTDTSVHGDDAWELKRNRPWPYGAALKVPNYQKGEYGYIGLMTDRIRVGQSYWNWLKQPDILRREFVLNPKGLGLSADSDFAINNGVVYLYSRSSQRVHAGTKTIALPDGTTRQEPVYSTNYSLSTRNYYWFSPQPEIFAKDADVFFFTMFKQYNEDFDWSELMGNERRSIKVKAIPYYNSSWVSRYPRYFDPPLYPGAGCPAIGFSPGFFDVKKDARGQDDREDLRTVYIYKDRHRLILAIHWRDRWETANVGFFEPFGAPGEYPFPAMAVGGTSGVLPITELVKYGNDRPSVEQGFRLDYTEDNWALSHGIPTYASTWWDGSSTFLDNTMYSQAQAMLPDGNWQSFANFGVRQDVYYNYRQGWYFTGHKEPERIPASRYFLTSNFSDLQDVANLIPTGVLNTADYEEDIDLQNRSVYQLEPIYLVHRTEENINQNMLGKIKNMYWCSRPVTRYGFYETDGKSYLIVPNAWEGRKYHIKHFFGALMGEGQTRDNQFAEMERLERLSRCMNLAIALDEEGERRHGISNV